MDVQEQRVSFVVTASRGEKSLTALCQEFGISRPTGYLWLSRYRREGLVGIAERSRRPVRSPDRTAAEMEEAVVGLRQGYPDWGARKLRVLLRQRGMELARSTIHRILLRHGMIHELEHPGLAAQRFERSAPNELWQMDYKGPLCVAEGVGPLSVLDDHSRYLLVLQRVVNTSGELVREHLQGAFRDGGVPDGMLMDHGTPWWSAQSPQGFTKLSLWLMKQGIALHWGRIRHPQTQGRWSAFMASCSGRCGVGRRERICRSGWMSFAGNTIMCGRTKRWTCRPRPAAGGAANALTIRTLRHGNIRPARGCSRWTVTGKSSCRENTG